jgi:hypothetical protein
VREISWSAPLESIDREDTVGIHIEDMSLRFHPPGIPSHVRVEADRGVRDLPPEDAWGRISALFRDRIAPFFRAE